MDKKIKNIVFITGNEGKRKEVETILGKQCKVINLKLDLPEIQSINVEDVINEKIKVAHVLAKENFDLIKSKFKEKDVEVKSIKDVIIICEDTGLHIKKMNEFPGALIKFYFESIGSEGIIKRDKKSKATTICVIGIIKNGQIIKSIIGKRTGKIANTLNGINGFGWDPIFVPNLKNTEYSDHNGKSYAELDEDIKNKISHRCDAFNKFKKKIIK
jgi:non-canonical purine NTP pyrophosphatase (RdgB/HAM1 family)